MQKKYFLAIGLAVALICGCASMNNSSTEPVAPIPRPQIEYSGYQPTAETTFSVFKGFNVASHRYEENQISSTVTEMKNLGANILAVELVLLLQGATIEANMGGKNPERHLSLLITEAHRQGLLVELRPVAITFITGEVKAEEYATFLNNAKTVFRYWAKFAEQYHVYQFTLFAEADLVHRNFFDIAYYFSIMPSFCRELLAETRKDYNGKVGIGFGPPYDPMNYDLTGFDYLEMTVNLAEKLWFTNFEEVMTTEAANVQPTLSGSGIATWLVGEADIVVNQSSTLDAFGNPVTDASRADFFSTLFRVLGDQVNGFYINGLSDNKWTEAKEVIKSWFDAH
jgi:hypothetical protein